MTDPQTPATEAGRQSAWDALYDDFRANHGTSHWSNILSRHRDVIEAEARADYMAEEAKRIETARKVARADGMAGEGSLVDYLTTDAYSKGRADALREAAGAVLDRIRTETREAVLEGDVDDCSSADCIADAVYEIVRVALLQPDTASES